MPDGITLMFVRRDNSNNQYDLVRYNTRTKSLDVQPTKNADVLGDNAYDLSISPDRLATVVSACCRRYGSANYWRLMNDVEWKLVGENLGPWGGWSPNGWLLYATDGRDLRKLDSNRSVSGSDIRVLISRPDKPIRFSAAQA